MPENKGIDLNSFLENPEVQKSHSHPLQMIFRNG